MTVTARRKRARAGSSAGSGPDAAARLQGARYTPLLSGCCALGACALALLGGSSAGALADSQGEQPKAPATASVEQCIVSASQVSRSATFAGEMTAVPGTERMQMSVQLLERLPADAGFHAVDAPGVSVWRSSAPGVQSYKYLRRVTNLAAPASYRAAIRFRWLDAKGRPIDSVELRTHRCEQPAP